MIRITSQKRRVLVWLFFSLLASGACFYYFRYMYIAGSRVPFMDFFKWIAMYAEDVHNGAISVMQFFTDVNEQVQPGALALVFWLLECTDYDVWPLMILGAIIQCVRCVIIGAIAMIPCVRQKTKVQWMGLFVGITLVCLELNFCQWELLMEPFEVICALRIILFMVVFWITSKCFTVIFEKTFRTQLGMILLLCILNALVTFTFASAYFVGFVGAISIAGIILMIDHRTKLKAQHSILAAIWALFVVAIILIYMGLMPENSSASLQINGEFIINIIRGILLYYGAAVIPQQLSETLLWPFYAAGIVLCLASIAITVFYEKMPQRQKSYFPILLSLYGFISALVIAIGRISTYGVETMLSSRYSVESIVGISGTVMMAASLFPSRKIKFGHKTIAALSIGLILIGVVCCDVDEMQTAPYRAEYQKSIVSAMVCAEFAEDDELSVCQAEPEYVRDAVRFLKVNKLSIFKEGLEKDSYSFEDAIRRKGVWADGWTTDSSSLLINTGKAGTILVKGYIPFDLPDASWIEITLDRQHYDTVQATKGEFSLQISTTPNAQHMLDFQTDFVFDSPPDTRKLSFLITALVGE